MKYFIGILLLLNLSFGKNIQELTKEATQGNVDAQFTLGVMYTNGKGVRQNDSEAKEWFGKSCDNGSQEGCDAYKELNLK